MASRRYSPICRAVPSAVLSAMLPAKPSVTTTSTLPSPDIVAFDEADIVEIGQRLFAQYAAGLAHLFETLHLLDADIEEPHGRPRDAEQNARHGRAHHGEIDEMLGVGADRGADIEHDEFPAQRRPERGDRRPLDPGERLEFEFRHRHQGAGIAGRDRDVGLPLLHRVDGEPHRRFPAAVAQRLARLVLHPHRDVGVDETRGCLQRRPRGHERRDQRGVAEQKEFALADDAPTPAPRRRQPRQGHGLPPSRREQCGPFAAFNRPCGPRVRRHWRDATERENSGSAPGHNCDQRPCRPFFNCCERGERTLIGPCSRGGWKTAPGLRG